VPCKLAAQVQADNGPHALVIASAHTTCQLIHMVLVTTVEKQGITFHRGGSGAGYASSLATAAA
jgi:hypothetical protein